MVLIVLNTKEVIASLQEQTLHISLCVRKYSMTVIKSLAYGEPQGLLITFGSTETTLGGYCCNVVNNQVQVKLYCDEDATDFAHTDFTLTTEVVSWDSSSYNLTHTAIGNSSLGKKKSVLLAV